MKKSISPASESNLNGVRVLHGALTPQAQNRLLEQVRNVVRAAPLIEQTTSRGRKMSVRMTAAGKYGWLSDRDGYRYSRVHPNGRDWPEIPEVAQWVWSAFAASTRLAECCLINFYDEGARMGLHQDRDEADFDFPVVSISLGDDGLFRVGGATRGGPTRSVWLKSGDVAVLGGPARLAYHGVDRIRFGSSQLLSSGGRLNLTLRVVD